MSTSIRDLFRRRRYPMDERLPDGASADDLLRVAQSSGDVNSGQGGAPLNQPVNALPVTRPRRALVQQAVTPPVAPPIAQPVPQQPVQQPVAQPVPISADASMATRDRRTQPRDYVADDEAAYRTLLNQKDPFWKRAVIAGINAAQAGFGQQPTPIMTSRMRDMAKLQGNIGQDLKVGQEQARIGAEGALQRQRELEPMFKQQQIEQDQRIADARNEIDRRKMAGEISKQEADRKQRELDRQSRENIAAQNRATQEKIAGMRGGKAGLTPYQQQEIETKQREGATKRAAKLKEAQDYRDYAAIEENNAAEAEKRLGDAYKEDVPGIQKDIAAKRAKANDWREKARKSQADAESIPEQQSSAASPRGGGQYSGKRFSRVKVAARARQLGMTPEQAEKQITDGGGIIY